MGKIFAQGLGWSEYFSNTRKATGFNFFFFVGTGSGGETKLLVSALAPDSVLINFRLQIQLEPWNIFFTFEKKK